MVVCSVFEPEDGRLCLWLGKIRKIESNRCHWPKAIMPDRCTAALDRAGQFVQSGRGAGKGPTVSKIIACRLLRPQYANPGRILSATSFAPIWLWAATR